MTTSLTDQQFLDHLQALGIQLFLEGDGLRFRTPQGVFTPALREAVQARKPALLALLRGASPSAEATIPRIGRESPPRMSFAQERIWFLYRFEGPSSTYSITPVFRVRGALSLIALEQALAALAVRHETLRMRFAEIDGIGVQVVDPLPRVPVEVVSLREVPAEQRLAEAERLILQRTAQPFDLENGPLLRVTLLALDSDDHILLPFMHHIIGDGWSLGVFHREFGQLYEEYAGGRAALLPPLPIQYPDYAAWQRARQEGTAGQEGLRFWRVALAGAPQTLALPSDFPRPAVQSFNGRVLRQTIPPAVTQALNELARAQGGSLFMVLLAAYGVLLLRHCGQDDILIGSPVANRPLRETEGLIGCFVNTVVLRLKLDGNPPFVELLQRVRKMALDAYAHQDVPVEAVIDALAVQRDPSRIPLYQAQFSLQNVPVNSGALTSIAVEPMPMDRVAAKNDLSFILEQGAAGIDAELEYNSDLFLEATVRRLGADYQGLLDVLAAAPATPILDLSMPSEQALAQPESAPAPVPAFADLVSAFEHAVACHPNAVAVRDSCQALNYATLDRHAERVAAHLLALPPETPVGLLMGRSVEMIAVLLGILKAGCAYLPLSPDHPPERLRYCLTQSGAGALLHDAERAELAAQVAPAGVTLLDATSLPDGGPLQRPVLDGGRLAYVIFTSGSTGQPKGVMIEHRAVLNLVEALRAKVYGELGAGLKVALMASTVFDASVQQIFPALLDGHTLCLIDEELRQDGARLCERLHEWRIDVTDCTPSLLTIMLRGGLAERCGATLRHILVGGEPLPRDLILELYANPAGRGILVSNVYGPTECCVDVTCLRLDPQRLPAAATVPLGYALPNCRLLIVDAEGRAVRPGVSGELAIAGVCLGRGYVNDPAQTAARFAPLPALGIARAYRSGDQCRMRTDGVIEYLGRDDDQVKILGYRIELGEVESRLRQHPAIRAVTVQARVTSRGYREMAAYLVTAAPVTRLELHDFLCERLPDYMVPAYFVPLDELPLNVSGKVERSALPDPESAPGLASGVAHQAAGSAAEAALCAVWAKTLGVEKIGVRDNYFTSGGDSIKALQVAARLREAGWIMEIRDLFRHPTVAQLAPLLKPVQAAAVAAGPWVGRAPLSAVQRFFFETYGAAAQFNQALLLRCRQPLDTATLQRALALLHTQHDMLRCRFVERDGGWEQEILAPEQVAPVFERVDLRGAADPHGELLARCGEAQAGFELGRAPLFSALLFELPDGQRLLLFAHHLVVDGVSWRILLDDLEKLLGGAMSLPPRSASYPAWVASQQRYAEQHPAAEEAYWQSVPVLPSDQPGGDSHAERRELRAALSAQLTRDLLTQAHQAYTTEINDLLIAALVQAWCAWSGGTQCAVTMEGHGREPLDEELDLSRSVGWFTSIFPVAFPHDSDLGRQIKTVKEALRSLPHKGAGYTVLRYLAATPGLAPLPPLAFNYLGRFDASGGTWFEAAPEVLPPTAAPSLALPWPLEITAAVISDRLELTLAYSTRRYGQDQAQALLDGWATALHQVASHALGRQGTELTVSDIDYDGFTQDGLDAFLDGL